MILGVRCSVAPVIQRVIRGPRNPDQAVSAHWHGGNFARFLLKKRKKALAMKSRCYHSDIAKEKKPLANHYENTSTKEDGRHAQ